MIFQFQAFFARALLGLKFPLLSRPHYHMLEVIFCIRKTGTRIIDPKEESLRPVPEYFGTKNDAVRLPGILPLSIFRQIKLCRIDTKLFILENLL